MKHDDPADAEERMTMLDPRVLDPDEELVARGHLAEEDLAQTVEVLEAMHRWREAERAMSEASQRYMKLGDTDMRALRFLIAMRSHGSPATPSDIAAHLGISTAAMTKMLDRLEKGGHVRRSPHPRDRRSLIIEITDETRLAARASVGRTHVPRFAVAAAMSREERGTVIRFFEDLVDTAVLPREPDAR